MNESELLNMISKQLAVTKPDDILEIKYETGIEVDIIYMVIRNVKRLD